MKTPHKHAELIKAWADGAVIEFISKGRNEWTVASHPQWYDDYEYRIQPERKPDVVRYSWVEFVSGQVVLGTCSKEYMSHRDLKLTFDGSTGKLKSAEVLK